MISPKSLMKIATTASVVAMTVSVAVVPAYAMQDIAIEDTPSSFAATVDDVQNSSNSMPDNPNATLPETVSENISDDSTVVSENLAVTPEGDVQNIETGETVTDAQLVGTQSQQPDPLAKTDGESFIPVSASDVKDAVEQPVKQSAEQSSLKGARLSGSLNSRATNTEHTGEPTTEQRRFSIIGTTCSPSRPRA